MERVAFSLPDEQLEEIDEDREITGKKRSEWLREAADLKLEVDPDAKFEELPPRVDELEAELAEVKQEIDRKQDSWRETFRNLRDNYLDLSGQARDLEERIDEDPNLVDPQS